MPIYMYIEIQYYDLLELLTYYKFYLLKVIYIVLYIFEPVATHGHAPSQIKKYQNYSGHNSSCTNSFTTLMAQHRVETMGTANMASFAICAS
jgi:hypothetical protein